MDRAISLSEARKNFSLLARETTATEITVHGKTLCYIVPKSEYLSLKKAALQKEFNGIFNEFDQLFRDLKNK